MADGPPEKRHKAEKEGPGVPAVDRARPVVGMHQVCGGKQVPTKVLERPPHTMPSATWHKQASNLDRKGPLSRDQLESFYRDGFLHIPGFFGEQALAESRQNVDSMIANLASRLFSAGKIKEKYDELDWTARLMRLRQDFADAPVVFIKGGILPHAFRGMFANKRILDMCEQLGCGPDLALNPAWNLRGKMPQHEETVVPWHQVDAALSLSLLDE